MTSMTRLRVALSVPSLTGVGIFAIALPLASCGSYDEAVPDPAAGGAAGQMTVTSMANAAGQPMSMGGTETGGGAEAGSGGEAGSAQTAAGGSATADGAGGTEGGVMVSDFMPDPVDASCETVTPCGGDVVGTWYVAGSCLPVAGDADMSGFGLGCTAAPVTGALEVSGTFTANEDGTFVDETTTTGASEITLPQGCLEVSGTVTTCGRLSGALQALGFASVDCVDGDPDVGGCTCSVTADQSGGIAMLSLDAAPAGNYTAADNVLRTSARTDVDYSYCVSENTLTMTPATVGRTGPVAGTIVLVKP